MKNQNKFNNHVRNKVILCFFTTFLIVPLYTAGMMRCTNRLSICGGDKDLDPDNQCQAYERSPKEPTDICGTGEVTNPYKPFVICSLSELHKIRENLSGHYVLGKEIDMSITHEASKHWIPIGSLIEPFSGTFNGGKHIIKNAYINISGDSFTGFFGKVQGSEALIKNVYLENIYVHGFTYVGGLVGWNEFGIIQNSYVTGYVRGQTAGGIIGRSRGGIIQNSYFEGTARGVTAGSGGIVGYSDGGIVESCYAAGLSRSSGYAGGVVGWQREMSAIINSFSMNKITSSKESIGGLVGVNEGHIYTSYSISEVEFSNIRPNQRGGGLVGLNTGMIENSYAAGNVILAKYLGAFIGKNEGGIIMGNNYYTQNTNAIGIGDDCLNCQHINREELENNFNEKNGFDSTPPGLGWGDAWYNTEKENFPCLRAIDFGRGGCPEEKQ